MPIKFTKHALERMKIRGISKEEIIEIINNPDKLTQDNQGNIIAQKLKKGYLFRVFYYKKENSNFVITTYKTSKFEKYL